MKELREVVIVDGCRTAVGNMGGALKPLHALDLAACVLQGTLDRTGIDPKEVDEVILGQCRQTSDEPNIARVAALKVGIPAEVPAYTVMRQCASGMTAVQNGAMEIMTGQSDVVLAGGTESMSNAVFYVRDARWGVGTGNVEFVDALTEGQFQSQPPEIYGRYNMGATADFDTDEFPRRDTNAEKMAKLKPCFNIKHTDDGKLWNDTALTGTVTAASSSGRNDGASVLTLMSAAKAKELGMKPIAKIIGMGVAGADPQKMGLGPVYAVPKALKDAGLTMDDIQLIELNEAFAAQALGCIKMLHWEDKMDIINVNGGAVALGHPVGSSGSRIIITLMYEMKRRGLKYGLATLCIAGGMGQATVIEMCD